MNSVKPSYQLSNLIEKHTFLPYNTVHTSAEPIVDAHRKNVYTLKQFTPMRVVAKVPYLRRLPRGGLHNLLFDGKYGTPQRFLLMFYGSACTI